MIAAASGLIADTISVTTRTAVVTQAANRGPRTSTRSSSALVLVLDTNDSYLPVARKRGRHTTVGFRAAPSAARAGAATQQLQQQQQQQPAMRHRSTARRLVSMGSMRDDTSVSLPNDIAIKPTAVRGRTAGRRPWGHPRRGNAAA